MSEAANITTVQEVLKELESAGGSVEKVEQLIKSLYNVPVSKNLLKMTGAGKKMTNFSKHKVPSVAKLANQLVCKWKKDLQSNMSRVGGATEASSTVGRPAPAKIAQPTQEEPTREPQDERKIEAKSKPIREADQEYEDEMKQAEEDGIDYDEFISDNYTDDKIRQNIRKGITMLLQKCCSKDSNKKRVEMLAIKIELGLIKEYGKIVKDYSNKSRTVLANLKRSDEFKKRILSGDVKPEDIATMDPKLMQDSELIKKKDEMEKDIIDSKRSDFMIKNMTAKEGMYTCSKCKGKKTTFYEQQTRSADEPMTTFVNCLDCGHCMKF